MSIKAAHMPGNQLLLIIKTEPVGVDFERQGLTGILCGYRIAVSVQTDAKQFGRTDTFDTGDVISVGGIDGFRSLSRADLIALLISASDKPDAIKTGWSLE